MSADELAKVDIAVLNLVCALGLPGAEEIDIAECVHTLNGWAETVRKWTNAAYPQQFLTNPGHYFGSEAFFKAVCLVNALQKRCGLKYHPAKKGLKPEDPFDFDDYFIWSVLQGVGGTCATLPVVYAAVGRRLGYPIKLVVTKQHMFARWDDPTNGDRFNIEGTNQGFDSFSDDHYRNWPYAFPPEDERPRGYLRSFNSSEELANFVNGRARILRDLGHYREAAETWAFAAHLDSDTIRMSKNLLACLIEWKKHLQTRLPPQDRFPRYETVCRPNKRRWPESVPWPIEREFAGLMGLEDMLNDPAADHRWWQPLREGREPLEPLPQLIEAHYPPRNRGQQQECR
jgi:hypothetical protein